MNYRRSLLTQQGVETRSTLTCYQSRGDACRFYKQHTPLNSIMRQEWGQEVIIYNGV